MDQWRRRIGRPPHVAGRLRGGTENRRSWQQRWRRLHQQQQQQQQQQQLFAGNCFTVNVEIRTAV